MAKVEARGVGFNVQTLGGGDRTVVFLHGLLIDNLSSWYMTAAPALTPSCSVVLYDQRGHGLSDQPETGYTLADSVLDLAALLEALNVSDRPVALVGNSYGGRIALAYASRFPEGVERIMLVDSHIGDTDITRRLKEAMELEGDARERRAEELFQEWFGAHQNGASGLDAAYLEKFLREKKARRRQGAASKMADLAFETTLVDDIQSSPELTGDELARITCPVLALYGEGSDVQAQGEALAQVLPDYSLELVPDCGHFVIIHRPDYIKDALTRWFSAAAGSPVGS